MNSNTLINKVRIKSAFDKKTAEWVFHVTFDEIKKYILKKKVFVIDEFGAFEIEHRKMKTVADYGRKAEVLLPPKDKISFKPSDKFLSMLKD